MKKNLSKEKDTLPDWERMFEILTNIQTQVQETNQRLEKLESCVESIENRVSSIEKCVISLDNRLTSLENRVDEGFERMGLRFVSVEARLERVETMGYEALSVAKNVPADMMILREELNAQLIANFCKPKPDPLLSL